jgi:hypothetical protein
VQAVRAMIRHHIRAWATGLDRFGLAVGTACVAVMVGGWCLLAIAWSHLLGVPAVNAAAVALIPLWLVVSILVGLLNPRPAPPSPRRRAAPAAPPRCAGAPASRPVRHAGRGAGRHRTGPAVQLPAHQRPAVYRPGRATVTHLDPPGAALMHRSAGAAPGTEHETAPADLQSAGAERGSNP